MEASAMKDLIPLTERKRGDRCCGTVTLRLSPAQAEATSADLTILAHPIRLQILAMLGTSNEPVCVCDLEAELPVKQPTVSHHLRLLREAGLIDCEKRGLWAYYFARHDALTALRARLAEQLAALG